MGVQLNIKDRETVELARAMARKAGKSVTQTIHDALQQADRAEDRKAMARSAEVLATIRSMPCQLPPEWAGKTSRDIIREFHDQEWQEQYGSDT